MAAQTEGFPAGRFDEIFDDSGKAAPIFTRPEVIARLPPLPPAAEDDAPAATAATEPPETAPAATAFMDAPERPAPQGAPEPEKRTGVASALKNLIAPPAEAGTAPPAASGEPPQASDPSDTTASLASPPPTASPPASRPPRVSPAPISPTRVSRLGQNLTRMSVARRAGLNGAGRRIAPKTVPPGRPTVYSRLGGGRAVWYQHPGRTASGERFNPDGLTAAHKTLPLGTRVRVVNKRNGRAVVVRINDRVPATVNAAIDLSRGSARALGIEGVGSVALYKVR